MVKAIEYTISGLKCDAQGCAYRDDNVRYEDYDNHLNAPCPLCGGNLLTEADLAATRAMVANIDWINSLAGDVPDEPRVHIDVNLDGTGVPDFTVSDQQPRESDNG